MLTLHSLNQPDLRFSLRFLLFRNLGTNSLLVKVGERRDGGGKKPLQERTNKLTSVNLFLQISSLGFSILQQNTNTFKIRMHLKEDPE